MSVSQLLKPTTPVHRDERDRLSPFHKTRLYRGTYHAVRLLIRAFLLLLARTTVRGAENVPKRGPLIIACNHLHNFDPLVVGSVIPRNLQFMAKKELFAKRWAGRLIHYFGAFSIDRGTADRAALRFAVHVVEDGEALFMFPEGTRSLTGKIARVLPGAAFVAVRTDAPILPVSVIGTETLPLDAKSEQAGKRRRSRASVTVTIGTPFHLSPGPNGKRPDMQSATDEIMRHVAALLPSEYRGIYGDETPPTREDGA